LNIHGVSVGRHCVLRGESAAVANAIVQSLFSRRRHYQLFRKRWHSGSGSADSRSRR
jgi:hypothetical protein